MTITLHWWIWPLILFVIPIIYAVYRDKHGYGDYDFGLDAFLLMVVCWIAAIAFIAGRFFK
jgi:hypothetical protein